MKAVCASPHTVRVSEEREKAKRSAKSIRQARNKESRETTRKRDDVKAQTCGKKARDDESVGVIASQIFDSSTFTRLQPQSRREAFAFNLLSSRTFQTAHTQTKSNPQRNRD